MVKMDEIKPGDVLIPDGGFTCLKEGRPVNVHSTGALFGPTQLFVLCDEGRHYLTGQLNDDGETWSA